MAAAGLYANGAQAHDVGMCNIRQGDQPAIRSWIDDGVCIACEC